MKIRQDAHQKRLLFEQEEMWRQLSPAQREEVVRLLAEMLQDLYLWRETHAEG